MINGIFENYSLSWEERLGNGMLIATKEGTEKIIFEHERINDQILRSKIIKDNKILQIDSYETYRSGKLKRVAYQIPGKLPHWLYEYKTKANGVIQVTRTKNNKEILVYNMPIRGFDKNGKIKTLEYRIVDSNKLFATIHCERNGEGNLIKETSVQVPHNETLIFYADKFGRYLKMEILEYQNEKSGILKKTTYKFLR